MTTNILNNVLNGLLLRRVTFSASHVSRLGKQSRKLPPIARLHHNCPQHLPSRCSRLAHSSPHLPFATLSHVRYKSTVSEKPRPWLRVMHNGFAYCGIFLVTTGVAIVGFFIYDASTYKDDPSVEDIPVSELALTPKRGGAKNLPIAEHLLDDDDCQQMAAQKVKPKLVILGTGWGSMALLKTLNPGEYHVTVVSPTNYFLFTPMLPSATVGTLTLMALVEPVRRIIRRIHGHFIKAEAEDVDFSTKMVELSQVDADGNRQHFYLPYDKLIIGVGMYYTCFFSLSGCLQIV